MKTEPPRIPLRMTAAQWDRLAKTWMSVRDDPTYNRFRPVLDRMTAAVREAVRGVLPEEPVTIPAKADSCFVVIDFGQKCPSAAGMTLPLYPCLSSLIHGDEA